MANRVEAPRGLGYAPLDATAVVVQWLQPLDDAEGHEIRGGGCPIPKRVAVPARSAIVRGLPPARNSTLEVRAYRGLSYSDWAPIEVRTSHPIPEFPTRDVRVIPVIDADRQTVQLRLPRVGGVIEDVKLHIWWSPSDNSWWGGIEIPVNTWAIRSRNLSLNCGLFDDVKGILAGNIVMRATGTDDESEPDRMAFVNQTHRLTWEPE